MPRKCFLDDNFSCNRNFFLTARKKSCVNKNILSKKPNPVFGDANTCGCDETTTGVVRISVIFQDRPMCSHIIQKVSARAFHGCGWTQVYIEKLPKYAPPPVFVSYPGIPFPKRGFCFFYVLAVRKMFFSLRQENIFLASENMSVIPSQLEILDVINTSDFSCGDKMSTV